MKWNHDKVVPKLINGPARCSLAQQKAEDRNRQPNRILLFGSKTSSNQDLLKKQYRVSKTFCQRYRENPHKKLLKKTELSKPKRGPNKQNTPTAPNRVYRTECSEPVQDCPHQLVENLDSIRQNFVKPRRTYRGAKPVTYFRYNIWHCRWTGSQDHFSAPSGSNAITQCPRRECIAAPESVYFMRTGPVSPARRTKTAGPVCE